MILASIAIGVVCSAQSNAPDQTSRRKLDRNEVIQGYQCAKTYAWFYTGGRLQRCTVSQETIFGEVKVPAGSIIHLLPDGHPNYAMMAHNTLVLGLNCSGGGPLGPSEGATAMFYPSGKFKSCFLAKDQLVQGVPCAHGGIVQAIVHRDVPVELYENGRLKSCLLAADHPGQRRGDRFEQGP
ncbi:MAG: hypothetical protein WA815_05350 [Terracidiphilus sp.]